jgi:hypothetical protein
MSGELPSWSVRPREIANLLNPAFTSLVIARSVAASEAAGSPGLALPLTFLVLPAVLHPGTRDALPRAATTTMYGWLGDHPHLKALFPARASAFVPFTQEATGKTAFQPRATAGDCSIARGCFGVQSRGTRTACALVEP